jgi:hypothetical protein
MREMRAEGRMRQGLLDLCRHIPAGSVGLEIGSFAGESAELIMSTGRVGELYCVDPWRAPPGRFAEELAEAETRFDAMAARTPGVVKCKGRLGDFRTVVPPCGFVYVDARHDMPSVVRDIHQALLFVRHPCLVAGHDYSPAHMGVVNAVNLCFDRSQLRLYRDGSWAIALPRGEK